MPPSSEFMMRSHADIDADLGRWTATAARIGKAIEGLTQDSGFLRLKTQLRLGTLTGITSIRGAAAVEAAEQLWMLYLNLDRQLAEAAELRRSNNPFGRDERFDKIDAILTGPAVALPGQASGLANMTLNGAPGRPATLAEVCSAMETAFETARDTVLAATRVWNGHDGLAASRQRIAALEAEAVELGCARPPSLAQASRLVAISETSGDADPIGIDDASAEIAALIAKADGMLASTRTDYAAAKSFLAEAETRLAEISAAYQRTVGLRAERMAKINDPAPLSSVPSDPTVELLKWLATLAKTVADRRPSATLIGAKSWAAQAAKSGGELDAVAAEDKKLLDIRADLRGRFSALTAKAEIRAAQGRLTPEHGALLQQTRALLFGAATPLPEAVALMRRCETI
jgi:hypothetical protein